MIKASVFLFLLISGILIFFANAQPQCDNCAAGYCDDNKRSCLKCKDSTFVKVQYFDEDLGCILNKICYRCSMKVDAVDWCEQTPSVNAVSKTGAILQNYFSEPLNCPSPTALGYDNSRFYLRCKLAPGSNCDICQIGSYAATSSMPLDWIFSCATCKTNYLRYNLFQAEGGNNIICVPASCVNTRTLCTGIITPMGKKVSLSKGLYSTNNVDALECSDDCIFCSSATTCLWTSSITSGCGASQVRIVNNDETLFPNGCFAYGSTSALDTIRNVQALSNADDLTPRGFYVKNNSPLNAATNQILRRCIPPCINCNTMYVCTKCEYGYYLYQSQTTLNTLCVRLTDVALDVWVPRGFLPDTGGVNVGLCNSLCYYCSTSATYCTKCHKNYYVYTSGPTTQTCVPLDPDTTSSLNFDSVTSTYRGFYLSNGFAFKCVAPCIKCEGSSNNCISCAPDSVRVSDDGGATFQRCETRASIPTLLGTNLRGYYLSPTNSGINYAQGTATAINCPLPCKTCEFPDGGKVVRCLSCMADWFLYDFCGDTTCVDGRYLIEPSDYIMENGVKRGFYTDTRDKISLGTAIGYPCPSSCINCLSSVTCLTCPNNLL